MKGFLKIIFKFAKESVRRQKKIQKEYIRKQKSMKKEQTANGKMVARMVKENQRKMNEITEAAKLTQIRLKLDEE